MALWVQKNATLLVVTVVSGTKKALNLDFTDINKNTVAYKSDEKFYRALPKGVRIVGK